MPARTLSPFQRDIARGFFARESRFFLSGGGALVGFHLHHRTTDDLDLFSLTAALEDGLMVVQAVASELGPSSRSRRMPPSSSVAWCDEARKL